MNGLLLQLAKLNMVRNIVVAFVVAIGSVAITWIANWKTQQNPVAPPASISAIAPAIAKPGPTSETSNQTSTKTSDDIYIPELIPGGDIYADKIAEHLYNNPRDQWGMEGFEVGQGDHFSFTVLVESEFGYRHYVQISEGKPNSHMYQFPYSCGCEAMTTPDLYRDVIYADPQRVAAKYANRLCRDCQKLQAVLDEKMADSSGSQQAE